MKHKLREKMISVGKRQARFNKTKLYFANEEIKMLSDELDRKLQICESQKISKNARTV